MSFKFRLQRILELREQAEQAKARALVTAQDAAEQARQVHETLTDLRAVSRAEISAAHSTEPRVGHLQQLGLVLESLDERVERADERVREADSVVTGAQQLLDMAARDRRMLDRLKDRHTDQWRAEMAQKDRIGMDEVALARFSRSAETRAADDEATRSRSDAATREFPRHDGASS
ncbi:MAG: flagellar export protein FliJ [Gemmatimonadaceae bacterium]|nr:flagellar export protein FliJ [Gemmatimonadaceae bacterium]